MADGAVSGQQQQQLLRLATDTKNGNVDSDAPLDFSVKRGSADHVTPVTSSQAGVTSFPVAARPMLLPMMDPSTAVMSALSAAGLLLRPPTSGPANPLPPAVYSAGPGDVTEQLRAYVRSKMAEEQRRLTQRASQSSSSSSSPSVDSSVERTASPVRSSPTSTTTPSAGFDVALPAWRPPPAAVPLLSPGIDASAAAGAPTLTPGSRKRGYSCPDTDSSTSKDTHYWERRRKNNEAAKRSRDARRAKEEEVAMRASILEQENTQLRVELTAFRLEVARLSELLCRQVAQQSSASSAVVPTTSQNDGSR